MADDILDRLSVETVEMYLTDNRRHSRTQGGSIEVNGYGSRLWVGSVKLNADNPNPARSEVTYLQGLQEVGSSFLIHSTHNAYLQNDPDGALSSTWTARFRGATSLQTAQVIAEGIPSSFEFLIGDRLSYVYDSGEMPTRHMMHEITQDSLANEGDGSRVLTVRSFVPVGVPDQTAISFIKPAIEAIVIPGSVRPSTEVSNITTGASFEYAQLV